MKKVALNVSGIIFMFIMGIFIRLLFDDKCVGETFMWAVSIILLCLIGFVLTISLTD